MAMTWESFIDWDEQGWRNEAACRHVDADLFFPVGSSGDAVGHIRAAQAICRRCPVQEACLRFALATNQDAGVWGGKDENERRTMRKHQRARGG